MSEVHKAISAHSAKQHEHIKTFMQLEHFREMAIEEAVAKCKNDEPFSTDAINEVTEKMNQLAKKGIVPTRRLVSKEMVKEYVSRT
ncbi:YpbS family protein [Bacillus mojavensis]|uniref:YpbS family protein n=1 Tax=Bacillus mojavensis TaxID=72360 RepID=UPI002DBAF567|nr:YpbS family protein [Bacillus mojavensis]MEC1291386.1 YpbS family protein [Bacillus mojavensis]MEC1633808.1 YpbS family protein [Bacillus mojavensis]MEC1702606.1 YpbS family protein [Bacillus mojavensis]MEC5247602.1 YpbS family protein [Bacillus mojavensis]